jgi:hypothetical protein
MKLNILLERVIEDLKQSQVDLKKFAKAVAWSYENDGVAIDVKTKKPSAVLRFVPGQIAAYGAFIDKLFKQKFVVINDKPFVSVAKVREYISKVKLPSKTDNQKWLFWCKEDPYASGAEMFKDMEQGIMIVYTGASDHPWFSKETNWKNRAVHDAFGHFVSDNDKSKRSEFNVLDELKAADKSIKKAPMLARAIFFTEVIGQAAYFSNNAKTFGTQKDVILQGFDMNNIGKMLPGYSIEDKWPFKVIKE